MKNKKILPFLNPKADKLTDDKPTAIASKSVESGELGNLFYEITKVNGSFGVIHIFDKDKTLCFKKDCDVFETEINKIDVDAIKKGYEIIIKGSGDNDNLGITIFNGEISLFLRPREQSVLTKLKTILAKNKG